MAYLIITWRTIMLHLLWISSTYTQYSDQSAEPDVRVEPNACEMAIAHVIFACPALCTNNFMPAPTAPTVPTVPTAPTAPTAPQEPATQPSTTMEPNTTPKA